MSKQKRRMMKEARDRAFHQQFKKVKRNVPAPPVADAGKPPTLTGNPRPLTTSFKALQERAIATPLLDDDVDKLDLNMVLDRHSKVIDYSSNYLLSVTLLACLRNRAFLWYVQVVLVSKATGKNILVNLLTPRQREDMKKGFEQAIEGVGLRANATEFAMKDARVWEVPFEAADYEKLLEPFQALTFLADYSDSAAD